MPAKRMVLQYLQNKRQHYGEDQTIHHTLGWRLLKQVSTSIQSNTPLQWGGHDKGRAKQERRSSHRRQIPRILNFACKRKPQKRNNHTAAPYSVHAPMGMKRHQPWVADRPSSDDETPSRRQGRANHSTPQRKVTLRITTRPDQEERAHHYSH